MEIRGTARRALARQRQEHAAEASRRAREEDVQRARAFAHQMHQLYGIKVPANSLQWESEGLTFEVGPVSSGGEPSLYVRIPRRCGHEHQAAVGGMYGSGGEIETRPQWVHLGDILEEAETQDCPDCAGQPHQ